MGHEVWLSSMQSVCTLYIRVCTCLYHCGFGRDLMQQTTHCTGVMHTAMIQQQFKAGCCQISVEYWKMYRHVCTMYTYICKFLSMYMKWTGITYLYRHVCTITYLYVHHDGINMYIACIYRFYIPVQGQTHLRIPPLTMDTITTIYCKLLFHCLLLYYCN